MQRIKKAFTIVELVIVMAVISLLAAVLIPTFSAIVNKANVSADTQTAASMSIELAIHHDEITSANELYEVLEAAYGDDNLAKILTPKSANKGYHFWYDAHNNTVVLMTYDQLKEASNLLPRDTEEAMVEQSGVIACATTLKADTFKDKEANNFKFFMENYLLLDRGGSIGGALHKLEDAKNADTEFDFKEFSKPLIATAKEENDENKSLAEEIIKKLSTTAIVTNAGTFILAEDINNVDKIFFLPGTKEIKSPVLVNPTTGDVSSSDYIARADKIETITIPTDIDKIHSGALNFLEIPNETVIVETGSLEIFMADATNGTIVYEEAEYTIEGDVMVDENGYEKPLEYSAPVDDFTITAPSGSDYTAIITSNDAQFYIAYNSTASITFGAKDFKSEGNDSVSSEVVTWSSNSEYITVDENGNLSFTVSKDIENASAVITATAAAGGHAEYITVTLIRPTYAEFTLGTTTKDLTVDPDTPVDVITYDFTGTKTLTFTDIGIDDNLTETIDIPYNKDFSVTTEGNLFEVEKNKNGEWELTFLGDPSKVKIEGEQTFTVTVGTVLEKTFNFKVTDKTNTPFELKSPFNGASFLYRVGNENAITLGTFFDSKKPEANISLKIYDISSSTKNPVAIGTKAGFSATVNGKTSANGSWTVSSSDWENTKILFSGTGAARIDFGGATFTFEVVDGKNVLTYADFTSNGDESLVMLSDVKMSSGSRLYLQNRALYGNDFTFDVSAGNYTAKNPNDGSYALTNNCVIYLNSGIIDNARIVGRIYNGFSALASENNNICNVISLGDSKILNSFISYCAAPVRLNSGNLEIVNTTLKGGSIANLDIRGGTVTLDNVTTINQRSVNGKTDCDGTVGFGILVWYENAADSKIIIKNSLTQYNNMCENDVSAISFDGMGVNGSTVKNAIFGANNGAGDFINTVNNVKWVNTGIFVMDDAFNKANIVYTNFNEQSTYKLSTVSYSSVFSGYLYSVKKENQNLKNYPDDYASAGQGVIPSDFTVDNSKNNVAKVDGSNVYCYYEDGTIYVSFDEGGKKALTLKDLCTAMKGDNKLTFTNAYLDGALISGDTVELSKVGEYALKLEFADGFNYDSNGNAYNESRFYTISIHVSVVKATAKKAEFTFKGNVATETIIVDNNTYVSAKNVAVDGTNWGAITIGNQTVIYPIISATIIKSKSTEGQAHFPVFYGAVTITDYIDNNPQTYGDSTTSNPSGLTVIKGTQNTSNPNMSDDKLSDKGVGNVFKWAASGSGSGPSSVNIDGADRLCYSSPSSLSFTNRTDRWTIAQYQYTDNVGTVYYYYVGYYLDTDNAISSSNSGSGSCVTPDTLITLADGTQKRVDELNGEELLLVWNLEKGSYDVASIVFVDSEDEREYNVIHLNFSDGTEVKVIGEHGFFDLDLGEYVYIDETNYLDFVGHSFVKSGNIADDAWEVVTLESAYVATELTTAWSPVTFGDLCYYTNGVLSMPGGIEGLFNIFEVDTDTMSYDRDKMLADIENYGLFTIEDFGGMIPEEAFNAFNGAWLKVAIGKGILTWEDIASYAERYIPLM